MTIRVLIVEDEVPLARALAVTLRANRYDATVAHTGAAALDAVASRHPDLVVLDLGLPDLDGMEVLRAVRAWSHVPVVVLSARQTSDDKVEALDAGADDYVTKPFGMDELLARIRAAARRRRNDDAPSVVHTAAFSVDLAARRVRTAEGADVRLTPTEWHMLEILARHVGKVVGQRELLQELRGPALDRETHYLRVYLAQLRRKLEPDPTRPRHLVTEPGMGYRLEP
jgi:two-component system, OmpR family, KDP operon response regulator KdpE